ncbi:MAG: hypothetical protein ACU83U_14880, partial [Gammaproteobacteria bacterium]
ILLQRTFTSLVNAHVGRTHGAQPERGYNAVLFFQLSGPRLVSSTLGDHMLRELPNVRQVAGEPKRRWFFCHEIDLVVWEDEDGNICGFQLAYDKHRNEHSFSWNKDRGFAHYVVDDGEPFASVNNTPFLYANGPFKRDRVLEQFLTMASEMPPSLTSFIERKLSEFNGPMLP